MQHRESLDLKVKERLKRWPQRPPGLGAQRGGQDAWLRGRPTEDFASCQPFLKLPGSTRMRTLPDGLWLKFGGTPQEPYVDILAVEACGTIQNLLDKRSRFAPSTHSLLAVCPVPWLLAPIAKNDPTPRWQRTGVLLHPPTLPVTLPVRDMRVLYGLKHHHYAGFAMHQLPHAHEFFAPMETLMAEDSHDNPALQALISRACVSANFLSST
ncbi:MAG: hypothetical protein JO227_18230 [Acetobacteraceae bacterium]|nr:hypothetical protein [Acetobacteraceae bacterium]